MHLGYGSRSYSFAERGPTGREFQGFRVAKRGAITRPLRPAPANVAKEAMTPGSFLKPVVLKAEVKSPRVGQVEAQRMFLTWLKRYGPKVYDVVAKKHPEYIVASGLGAATPASSTGNIFTNLLDTIKTSIPAYFQFRYQKKVLDTQMSRMQAGLPPLKTEQYSLPPAKVEVSTPGLDFRKIVPIVGIGLAAIFILPKFLKR